MLELSIIIISYKSKKHLEVLLPSIFSSVTEFSYEVIVVDNDSQDGTVEWLAAEQLNDLRFKDLKIIRNQNTGFSRGNNLGIKQSTGRYVLLLNPDTKLEKDSLDVMLKFMESRQDVGVGGCKLVKADGKLDLACRRRFPNPWNAFQRLFLGNNTNYNYSDVSEDESMEVDSVVGAFMLIRREVLDIVGLFDEEFFMYGEDLDYCWRVKKAGYKVWYYPKAICHHYKGESSRKIASKALRWFYGSMWIFYNKHYAKTYPFVLNWIVYLGIYARMRLLLLINYFKSDPRVSR